MALGCCTILGGEYIRMLSTSLESRKVLLLGVIGSSANRSGMLFGTGGVGFFQGLESVRLSELEKVDLALDSLAWNLLAKSDREPPVIGIGSEMMGRFEDCE